MAYSPQGEHGISREKAYGYKGPDLLSKISEFFGALGRGQTPFVTQADVEREKDRRATLGLDPDYYTNPVEDIGLMQATPEAVAGREQRIKERLEQIQQRNLPQTAAQSFDNTLEGQYQRYFQTPEMDYVFGAGARGKDAPKDAAAMEVLGNQLQAPGKDTNIASMYRAQSAMGRVNEDAIQKMYEGDKNMQEWAKANPMLAQREYLKAEQRRAADIGNERERVQMDNPMGQEAYDLIKKQLLNKASTK